MAIRFAPMPTAQGLADRLSHEQLKAMKSSLIAQLQDIQGAEQYAKQMEHQIDHPNIEDTHRFLNGCNKTCRQIDSHRSGSQAHGGSSPDLHAQHHHTGGTQVRRSSQWTMHYDKHRHDYDFHDSIQDGQPAQGCLQATIVTGGRVPGTRTLPTRSLWRPRTP